MSIPVPHPIPYQGSKRRLAPQILRFAPTSYRRLYEPFVGSAALSLAAAQRGLAKRFILGDTLEPLAALWQEIVDLPEEISRRYREVWESQLTDPRQHYLAVREEFNVTQEPALLLYLVARCVKNAVRFNPRGEFNQSADHRRKGMNPTKMEQQISGASALLAGKTEALAGDYRELIGRASSQDLVYMDPPYQGVSNGRDKRYFEQLDFDSFLEALEELNVRDVDYLLSFDGSCGDRSYGQPLPAELKLSQVLIDTGRSSQATLAGRSETTVESLYISPSLAATLDQVPEKVSVADNSQMGLSLST